jgi:hypothetical protein
MVAMVVVRHSVQVDLFVERPPCCLQGSVWAEAQEEQSEKRDARALVRAIEVVLEDVVVEAEAEAEGFAECGQRPVVWT